MTYTGDSQVQRLTAGSASFAYTALGMDSQQPNGSAANVYYLRDNAGRLVAEQVGGSSYYYLFDGLGSIVAVTGSAGTALDTYRYDPYGQVTAGGSNSVVNPWQYAGGYNDSGVGLVKFGQRFSASSSLERRKTPRRSDGMSSRAYSIDRRLPAGSDNAHRLMGDTGYTARAAYPRRRN